MILFWSVDCGVRSCAWLHPELDARCWPWLLHIQLPTWLEGEQIPDRGESGWYSIGPHLQWRVGKRIMQSVRVAPMFNLRALIFLECGEILCEPR